MPRVYPPKRTLTAVRLSPEGLEAIDAIAEAEDRPRSWVIRMLLSEALTARQRRAAGNSGAGVAYKITTTRSVE